MDSQVGLCLIIASFFIFEIVFTNYDGEQVTICALAPLEIFLGIGKIREILNNEKKNVKVIKFNFHILRRIFDFEKSQGCKCPPPLLGTYVCLMTGLCIINFLFSSVIIYNGNNIVDTFLQQETLSFVSEPLVCFQNIRKTTKVWQPLLLRGFTVLFLCTSCADEGWASDVTRVIEDVRSEHVTRSYKWKARFTVRAVLDLFWVTEDPFKV